MLEANYNELGKSLEKMRTDYRDLDKKWLDLNKIYDREKENSEFHKRQAEDCRKAFDAEQDRSRKMEQDIAKIRQALGELKMKEILGS